VRDVKDLGVLLLGFMPWLLFLFLAGHSLASLGIITTGVVFTALYKRRKRAATRRGPHAGVTRTVF
jgi:heme O synthase-like polyprenyltransferase